jgi:copper(I)-binding protein
LGEGLSSATEILMSTCHLRLTECAAALFAVSLSLIGGAKAADYKAGALEISQLWARATPKGADSGAAYLTVTNTGQTPRRLSCVSSDAAAKCQIHQMSMHDGVMQMRPVEDGVQIKPGETVTFKPGGYHIMLDELKHALQQGNTVEATLKASDGSMVTVQFPVAAIGAPAPGTSAGGGTMTMQGPAKMQMNKKH